MGMKDLLCRGLLPRTAGVGKRVLQGRGVGEAGQEVRRELAGEFSLVRLQSSGANLPKRLSGEMSVMLSWKKRL